MKIPVIKEPTREAIIEDINNGHLPPHIYKYMDIESIRKVIENNSIKFNSASNFNDPFDGKAFISINISFEDIVKYWDLDSLPDPQKQISVSHKIMDIHAMNQLSDSVYSYLDKHTAISCFSEIGDNPLMWSHYSDKHKGVCLKFDIIKDLDFFSSLARIKYNEDFLSYNFAEVENHIFDQYTTKAIDWSYEKEIRVIKTNTKPQCIKFNKASLVEISFGCKCDEKDIHEIKKLVKQKEYDNIEFKLATIYSPKYKLLFTPI